MLDPKARPTSQTQKPPPNASPTSQPQTPAPNAKPKSQKPRQVMTFVWGTSPVVACDVFNILWCWGPRSVRFVMFFRMIGESWCVSEIREIVVIRSASGPGQVMVFVWGASPVVVSVFSVLWSWGPRSVRFVMFFRIIGETRCGSEIGK